MAQEHTYISSANKLYRDIWQRDQEWAELTAFFKVGPFQKMVVIYKNS